MSEQFLPDAIDLSHHLSKLSHNRSTSPLKGLQKYWGQPGLISMAGGTPSPAYFPYASVSAEILQPETFPAFPSKDSSLSWLWNLFSARKSEKTETITIPKYPNDPKDLNLASLLQYSPATGSKQLQDIIKEYSHKVYRPAYSDWNILVHTGNTDGWTRAFMTFCNPGEGVLCAEWTYPSAMFAMRPYGVAPVPVGMDSQGMSAAELRKTLSEWDSDVRKMPRPHVMYIIPTGQNPTGATMSAERKKEIYDICVEYDIIIVEDDPYYILQHGEYVPQTLRNYTTTDSEEDFIESLVPTFLKFDYQGRVVRLDTFSKTIAPGCRLGWFTCNTLFAERLERQGETSSQAPAGFSQGMVSALLLKWHYEGYIRWLRGIRMQYAQRRDQFMDSLMEEFELRPSSQPPVSYRQGSLVLEAYPKPRDMSRLTMSEKSDFYGNPMFSLVTPTSGMFVWMRVHLEQHVSFGSLGYKKLENKLFVALAENGLLVGFGAMFSATEVDDDTPGDGHFRISYSDIAHDTMKKATSILGDTMRKFFKETFAA